MGRFSGSIAPEETEDRRENMAHLSNRQPVKLRLEIIAPQVGTVILSLFVLGLVDTPAAIWFIFVAVMVLMHTLLFYRLGRIAEQMSLEEE